MDSYTRKKQKTKRLWHSFKHALDGISYVIHTQMNMKLHVLTGLFILLLAIVLDIAAPEILWVILAILLVIITETLNTAVEKTVDLMTNDYHPVAKQAKDVAAAAVLFATIFALCVALMVFTNPVLALFGWGFPFSMHTLVLLFLISFLFSLWFRKPVHILVVFLGVLLSVVLLYVFLI